MKYPKTQAFDTPALRSRMMGPHPLKLLEELLTGHALPPGGTVMDLGCGQGLTSAFLAKVYGFRVVAADLWSDPTEIFQFFQSQGLDSAQAFPIHADANALPFARSLFDGVISVDSYHYFGREPGFLAEKLLPFVKPGGWLCLAVPGMKKDCHDALPPELLCSWTPEDLATLHDAAYWERLLRPTPGLRSLRIWEMESNREPWQDWLAQDNPYARGDRRAMEAGGGRYLNFIAMVLQKA